MKILRLTRHALSEEQAAELDRIYPGAQVEQVDRQLDPINVVRQFDELTQGFDVAEVVLPLQSIQAILNYSEFVQNGGVLIKSIMVSDREGSFSFSHYESLLKIEIVSERL